MSIKTTLDDEPTQTVIHTVILSQTNIETKKHKCKPPPIDNTLLQANKNINSSKHNQTYTNTSKPALTHPNLHNETNTSRNLHYKNGMSKLKQLNNNTPNAIQPDPHRATQHNSTPKTTQSSQNTLKTTLATV